MKTIISPQLSLLFATHTWLPGHETPKPKGNAFCDVLSLALLAGFSLTTPKAALLREEDIWQRVDAALPEGQGLDIGFPKPCGEFLIYGACHSKQDIRGSEVAVSCAGRSKRLLVFGQRFWRDGGASEPLPFTRMPLDWEHAFGGPEHAANPLGKGLVPVEDGLMPLPNVEDPKQCVASPGDRPEPAGFAALAPHWPQRARYYGTPDDAWLEQAWPGVPLDHNIKYACSAPEDQRLDPGVFFSGGEAVRIQRMHPEHEVLDFTLPKLRCRLFLQRVEGAFSEIPTVLETLWFFPELETGLMLFRGVSHANGEDCADVAAILADVEPEECKAKPESHYREWCAKELAPPAPPAEPEPAPEAEPAPKPEATTAMAVAVPAIKPPDLSPLEACVKELQEKTDAQLAALGVSKEDAQAYLDKIVAENESTISSEDVDISLDQGMQQLQDKVAELEANAKQVLESQGLDTSPEALQKILAKYADVSESEFDPQAGMKAMQSLLERPGLDEEARAGLQKGMEGYSQLAVALTGLKALEEKLGKPVEGSEKEQDQEKKGEEKPAPAPDKAPETAESAADLPRELRRLSTEQALERIKQRLPLKDFDLGECDFSAKDLSGADFSGALLMGAKFVSANLEGADFSGALCHGCDMSKASLTNTNFSQAKLDGADLSETMARGANFHKARMQDANLQKTNLQDANLREADLGGANLDAADCSRCQAAGVRLQRASLKKTNFTAADLAACRMGPGTDASGACFAQANMTMARMSRALLDKADCSGANLDNADCCKASCQGTVFRMASAKRCDFTRADLQAADLSGVNLFRGALRQANCSKARIENANLYGVDFYRCRVNPENISDCILGRTLLRPGLLRQAKGKP